MTLTCVWLSQPGEAVIFLSSQLQSVLRPFVVSPSLVSLLEFRFFAVFAWLHLRSITVPSYRCVYRLTESSLIGGVSADRLTNSLFINGLSVPRSERSQRRTIQFSSIDFMSPCRAIFITSIKRLIKDKKETTSVFTTQRPTASSQAA